MNTNGHESELGLRSGADAGPNGAGKGSERRASCRDDLILPQNSKVPKLSGADVAERPFHALAAR